MKGFILDYINENEFRKLERALKKYNMLAYKKLNFDYYPSSFGLSTSFLKLHI